MSAFTKKLKAVFNKVSACFGDSKLDKVSTATVDVMGACAGNVVLASCMLIAGVATSPLGIGIPLIVGAAAIGGFGAHKLQSRLLKP